MLFGGADQNGNKFNDTWIWDGVTWTQQFPSVSPPPRSLTSDEMVYDPVTGTVLLFGGMGTTINYNGGIPFDDTWEWNGRTRTWTQLFPATSPPARVQVPLAYDPVTGNVVLFGGDHGGDCFRTFFDDTWTWNGITWTQQFPASSPSGRTAHLMTYDPSLFQVVMFGGTAGPPSALGDTWAWNGTTWTQLSLPTSPSGRWNYGLAYDPLIDGLLLFGGELGGDPLTNQTWFLVPVPLP